MKNTNTDRNKISSKYKGFRTDKNINTDIVKLLIGETKIPIKR